MDSSRLRDPVPVWPEPLRDEAVAAFPAESLLGHETGTEKDAQVLGDGWAAHLEVPGDGIDGALGLGKEVEYPASRGMADRLKDLSVGIRSRLHPAIIRKCRLTCCGAERRGARSQLLRSSTRERAHRFVSGEHG